MLGNTGLADQHAHVLGGHAGVQLLGNHVVHHAAHIRHHVHPFVYADAAVDAAVFLKGEGPVGKSVGIKGFARQHLPDIVRGNCEKDREQQRIKQLHISVSFVSFFVRDL
ncbi:MAG: hypothetical protein DBX93_04705 [Oscillospiraceae bacterium]|nr:MAG: hypothetical protein DBX93_04705 [Oscillospiraceae bacterium]